MTDTPDSALFSYTKVTYDGSFETDLLDQYKLYVQSAENVSSRRLASSRYLLAVNAALVALWGFHAQATGSISLTFLLPILGILVSLLWYRIIRSHKRLNEVKFGIIHRLEEHLPAALFKLEWREAHQDRGEAYRAVTDIERWIPLLFLALHTVLFLVFATGGFSAGAASAG